MPRTTATVTLKDVSKDGVGFIEVIPTARITARKDQDEVVWNFVNVSATDIEVKVIDFFSNTGATPFADGVVPATVSVPHGQQRSSRAKDTNGDLGIYKYTIVARVRGRDPWFNVKDPELEIET